jgi:(p)ppGpp synthase/HD superfamily hydrolase
MARADEPARPPDFARGSARLLEACELAEAAHSGQLRKRGGGEPYVAHPFAVAERLQQAGFGEDILAAAILHDVVEDSEIGGEELAARFGARVGELVTALTDDTSIEGFVERKHAHRERVEEAGPDAAAIYAADKLTNLRDLRLLYRDVGERAAETFRPGLDERLALWRDDVEMAGRCVDDPGLVRDLREELAGFERDRSGAMAR